MEQDEDEALETYHNMVVEDDIVVDDEDDDDYSEDEHLATKRSRPDVAAKLKKRKTEQACAVKMTLNKLCTDDQLFKEIETCVHGVTRTAVEASRFLNYFVIKLLEEGEVVPKWSIQYYGRRSEG